MNTLHISTPCLLGDIGGTNARFALVHGDGSPITHDITLPTGQFADLAGAAQAYLARVGQPAVSQACIAIANPIDSDALKMTNNHWQFSIEATRQALGLEQLLMLNDWEAMAMAAPALSGDDLEQIGSGEPVPNAPKGLIGPGTGLGVSSLVRSRRGDWVPIAGEGGHVSLAPTCEREADILRILWRNHTHVSAERAISGMGLENLYRAICVLNGTEAESLVAAQVTERALAASDVACEEALDRMCRLLGNAAANLAVTLGARGGIFIGGGVIGRLGDYFAQSGFRAAFEAKGRFENYMKRIPTYVIRVEQPALIGCAMALGVQPARR
ncbi:glucokinase [Limnohabitans sp. Bal53]|uniref:glucokinase n=1 Tax=Limnohabitans sp. Bal53 TaxID=1977910 RepID=UPI000D3A8B0F|nr:glucokinase [Limnohabitans sp. Bal53]PUE39077.1 glucokinase [Limnohabitans sp. Bal53]